MEEVKQNSKMIPYPILAANLSNFKLKLIESEEYECMGMQGATLYLLIEEADDSGYVGMYIRTYTNAGRPHLKGKRVRFTFKHGVIEDDGKKEDFSNHVLVMEKI